jgi:hypothetical protein
MGVLVDVYTWPEITLAPGAEVTFLHWIVDNDGISLIDPERWYWMSAVPEFADVKPDRPVPGASLQAVIQGAYRDPQPDTGPNNTQWLVTWRNPDNTYIATFRPRMVEAPAR